MVGSSFFFLLLFVIFCIDVNVEITKIQLGKFLLGIFCVLCRTVENDFSLPNLTIGILNLAKTSFTKLQASNPTGDSADSTM
jgi:hypothetical protein